MLDSQMRQYHISYIEQKFNQVKDDLNKYALVQFNIKNFRFYHAKYGVEASNEILELVFQKLRSFLETDEYAGYLYADYFAVLVRCDDVEVLMKKRIASWIDNLYRIDSPNIYRNIFYSVGIYKLEEREISFYDALNCANLCRKSSEGLLKRCSSLEIYSPAYSDRYIEHMELEIKTADAYKNYQFVTYLQPKVELESGEIIGAEALLRWFDEDGTPIPLYKFLPILNENGYIILIDLDIFDQICQNLDSRIKNGQKIVPVSFNISESGFYDSDILQEYIAIFEKYDIPKEYIELEFMESISLNDMTKMKKLISGFRDYGFTCVLDDFGNGYSSFNVLLNAPLDIIKMDRQFFVDNLNGDGKLVIKTIVDLIHSLNMKVVAEGVEMEEHVKYLKACKCECVQGYYYYKPMPISAFEALLESPI